MSTRFRLLFPLALLAAVASPWVLQAAEGFETGNLALYQPDTVLKQRVPSVEALGAYFKKLEGLCQEHFAKETKASNLTVVTAVRPGKRSKVWFIPPPAEANAKDLDALRKKLEAQTPMEVHGGPFAFAICGKIAGGVAQSKTEKEDGPPIPEEWKTALTDAKKQGLIPDAALDLLWPALPGEEKDPETPMEFVTQELDPTGGEIERPKDWHYKEGHRENTLMWTLAKEDHDDGTYTTGVRIQMFAGVTKATSLTPKEFIEQFVEKKRRTEGVRVVNICDPQDEGVFKRVCLEIVEGPHHILYSLFWNNDMDMAAITIAGTSKELWHVYAPTFDRMNKFKLLDVKKLQEKAEAEEKDGKAKEK